ncbi:MAG: ATP-binding cassette domain-containing protein [Chloroflexi bacterium]|nr:ATP-binding cassette domain-containing protein [Chloroflexota bacterium]MBV9132418.1 ATP-binding cassette domain-containing protein [Chloroflexota bacterium]MBV9898404.1 ATP-binding cassette domain-containing protein [Chloroflexota bacterium]
MSARQSLLSVRKLRKQFPVHLGFRRTGMVSAVDDVEFDVQAGDTLGIVGESGCGKSTTARLILGLVKPDAGEIAFDSEHLNALAGRERKAIKRGMQMVFQDPLGSVNPRMSIGENIGFPLRVHGYSAQQIRNRTSQLLEQVGLHPHHASYFPHQLSGGQLQRVNTARALALEPKLIICDEPVSALDKSIQAQVLNLLLDLQQQLGLTYVFISHDLNVVEYVSDYVAVMYLGQVVEQCSSDELYRNPLHPYTRVLLSSIPQVDPEARRTSAPVTGDIPSALNPPSGCRFRTRCPLAMDVCAVERPVIRHPTAGHAVACHLYDSDTAERSAA